MYTKVNNQMGNNEKIKTSKNAMKKNRFFFKSYTAQNMPEYGFSLTRIFPYKDRIGDAALIRENMDQRKPVF